MSEADRLIAGRYRLISLVARGGMAEVWEGEDEVLARPVAIKLLLPHLAEDEAFRERFRREAVAAARLAHTNVVATFDTGQDDGEAYIVMELIKGETLRDLLDRKGALPIGLAIAVGTQVADALSVAHAAGVIHRDVKPANVLLCEGDPVPQVKVADFGIARASELEAGRDLTRAGALLGSVKYLSPEQVEGGEIDARSDVYSLGVVLYEMITGRVPFAADNDIATAIARLSGEPVRPRQVRAGIPRSVEAVVLRALSRDRAARFDSAAALAAALRSLDVGPDDALPLVERDPTPPGGTPASFRQSERSWLVPAMLIVAAGALVITAGVLFSRSEVGQDLLSGSNSQADAGEAIAVSAARSFDPEGRDREENESRARLAIDGNTATAWETDRYNTREFGNLKEGVGLRLDLPSDAGIRSVRVSSSSRGWDARVYVASEPGDDLTGWGAPVATLTEIDGEATFDLGRTNGRSVLLWITRLGEGNRVEIAEIKIGS